METTYRYTGLLIVHSSTRSGYRGLSDCPTAIRHPRMTRNDTHNLRLSASGMRLGFRRMGVWRAYCSSILRFHHYVVFLDKHGLACPGTPGFSGWFEVYFSTRCTRKPLNRRKYWKKVLGFGGCVLAGTSKAATWVARWYVAVRGGVVAVSMRRR